MKIALLGSKGTTLDLLHAVIAGRDFDIDLVVTLPEPIANRNRVAYYSGHELVEYCRAHGMPVHFVRSYDLKDRADVEFFREAAIDLLLVIGWERLLPAEVLLSLGRIACGMHGSSYGLPKGRGRSPLNWSILTEQNRFITYLFRYSPSVDDGSIIGFKVFDINPFDTIATLHLKNRIAMYHLLRTYVPLIAADKAVYWPQPPEQITFYPKRNPEDGLIDWTQRTLQVYNLIRAVAPPYPPAYCFHQGKTLYITEAYPFESTMFHSSIQPGTVVDISLSLGCFVVKTADGTLLVKKFEGVSVEEISVGDVLEGGSQAEILRQIAQRYHEGVTDEEKEIR